MNSFRDDHITYGPKPDHVTPPPFEFLKDFKGFPQEEAQQEDVPTIPIEPILDEGDGNTGKL